MFQERGRTRGRTSSVPDEYVAGLPLRGKESAEVR